MLSVSSSLLLAIHLFRSWVLKLSKFSNQAKTKWTENTPAKPNNFIISKIYYNFNLGCCEMRDRTINDVLKILQHLWPIVEWVNEVCLSSREAYAGIFITSRQKILRNWNKEAIFIKQPCKFFTTVIVFILVCVHTDRRLRISAVEIPKLATHDFQNV